MKQHSGHLIKLFDEFYSDPVSKHSKFTTRKENKTIIIDPIYLTWLETELIQFKLN